jgi:hypothetical protein
MRSGRAGAETVLAGPDAAATHHRAFRAASYVPFDSVTAAAQSAMLKGRASRQRLGVCSLPWCSRTRCAAAGQSRRGSRAVHMPLPSTPCPVRRRSRWHGRSPAAAILAFERARCLGGGHGTSGAPSGSGARSPNSGSGSPPRRSARSCGPTVSGPAPRRGGPTWGEFLRDAFLTKIGFA